MIELFNIDCMEYMKTCKDKQFDIAIVDVPYGINASKGTWGSSNLGKVTDYGKKNWDDNSPDQEYFNEMIRVSKNQIVFGANHFISKIPFDSPCWIVWDKDNSADFADCELAWTSFPTAVRKFKFRWNGMLQQDMKNKEQRIHPTQKPVKLYQWLLETYANKESKILDTHLGSGSIAIACHYFGCDFVGCEIDKEYFDKTKKRFEEQTKQIKMFGE